MQNYHLINRPDREVVSDFEIRELLLNGKFCVVSMCRNEEPYVVTLSYGYDPASKCLYMHCAPEGMKIDFIRANPRVCGTVIEDGGYVAGECAHNYRTVVFRGKMSVVVDPEEKRHGMEILLKQLEKNPRVVEQKMLKSEGYFGRMGVLKIEIDSIRAKAGK
ncbi:MAG TPA: pyridoxamine 5'-phosphate oxidase family protein [Paludibacter sp.]|nr:pyridoxamine 5'-phosphate oxidase family protein [Paludibacter sp.]